MSDDLEKGLLRFAEGISNARPYFATPAAVRARIQGDLFVIEGLGDRRGRDVRLDSSDRLSQHEKLDAVRQMGCLEELFNDFLAASAECWSGVGVEVGIEIFSATSDGQASFKILYAGMAAWLNALSARQAAIAWEDLLGRMRRYSVPGPERRFEVHCRNSVTEVPGVDAADAFVRFLVVTGWDAAVARGQSTPWDEAVVVARKDQDLMRKLIQRRIT